MLFAAADMMRGREGDKSAEPKMFCSSFRERKQRRFVRKRQELAGRSGRAASRGRRERRLRPLRSDRGRRELPERFRGAGFWEPVSV